LEALVVAPDEGADSGELTWARCDVRKTLAELGPVSRTCVVGPPEAGRIEVIGSGLEAEVALPVDVCSRFGPNPPPPDPDAPAGAPAGRPTDPDLTGGYYQPVRTVLDALGRTSRTVSFVRLACGLAGANADNAADFTRRYKPNTNPELEAVELGSTRVVDFEAPVEVSAGEVLELRAAWPTCIRAAECGDGFCTAEESTQSCAEDCVLPAGCAGAEDYVVYDRQSSANIVRTEALVVAWYATGGELEAYRTGPSEGEAFASNIWTVPEDPGTHTLWFVITDERGGAGWQQLTVEVR
jgi:hypothetical protein